MSTSLDPHTHDDGLAPGDSYIHTTNTTLFEVMDYALEHHEPLQIAQALGLTSELVYFALDYIEQHRAEIEVAYRVDRRATAQQFVHSLEGSYRPQWQDWMPLIGGMGMGIFFLVLGVTTIRPFFTATPAYRSTFELLINACVSLFCWVTGLGLLGLGSRLLLDLSMLRYEVSTTLLTTTRYGRIPAHTIQLESVLNVFIGGQFLYVACEDGTTYQMMGIKQLRDTVNNIPHNLQKN